MMRTVFRSWNVCMFLIVFGIIVSETNVNGQMIFYPSAALITDSVGNAVHSLQNKVVVKKLNDTLSYVTVMIEADKNAGISVIDIPVTVGFGDKAALDVVKNNFHWVPGINATAGQIIPQHLFRSPVMLFTFAKSTVVLIPDVKTITNESPAPYYMQVEYKDNVIVLHYGLSNYTAVGHRYYEKSGKTFYMPETLRVGFYVLNTKTSEPLAVLETTNFFLWQQFATDYTGSILPQTVSFDEYARTGYGMALDKLWVDAGKNLGGITLSTFFDSSTNSYRGRYFKNDLWFQSWFNNIRTAYGMYSWGKMLNRDGWKVKSMEMASLLLSAPIKQGWFPTIYDSESDRWIASSQKRGSVYHVPDNAWTAYWLLRFNDEMQKLPGAAELLVGLGEAVLRTQNENGSFPAMINAETLASDSTLNNSASSAMATWYLEELLLRGKIPPPLQARYKKAIERSLAFLSDTVLPEQLFEDFESYFSCSPKPLRYFDSSTNLYAQNTLSIQWCAEAYLKAFILFKDPRYLAKGEYCLNILSLYQQVWNPPFISFYAFGGFGVQNTDAEWNDARQAQFADTYLQYYKATGKKEYRERAIAACRASFALMVLPENKEVCPNNYTGTSINGESWPGTMAENYGHSGYDQRSYQSGFHWGRGSALTTAAIFARELSGFYSYASTKKIAAKKQVIHLSDQLRAYQDISLLPVYETGVTPGQESTYDRTGGNNDGFSGAWSFIRKEADSSLVIFEQAGPGVIQRIWTPTPTSDTLDIYVDDMARPVMSVCYTDLFSGKVFPFIPPLCGSGAGGYYSYFPILFNKACKIVCRGKKLQFHQIQYKLFSGEVEVESFRKDISATDKKVLGRIAQLWQTGFARGAKEKAVNQSVTLQPRQPLPVFQLNKGGRITSLEIEIDPAVSPFLDSIQLLTYWDGSITPAINSPLADFFGYASGVTAMQGLLIGSRANSHYCFLPMPFERSATVTLTNQNQQAVKLNVRVRYNLQKQNPVKEGKLYVKRQENALAAGDPSHVFLSVTGKGHYIGTILWAKGMKAGDTGFFEGDDSTSIDGKYFLHGTGSEDYFNGGWYNVQGRWDSARSFPLSGCLGYSLPLSFTGGYRFYLGDKLSFTSSFFHSMEHGRQHNDEAVHYRSLAFYYAP